MNNPLPTLSQPFSISFPFLLCLYAIVEALFYLHYSFIAKPRANDLSKYTPQPFRDYGNSRYALFKRILERMERSCKENGEDFAACWDIWIRSWFTPDSSFPYSNENNRKMRPTMPHLTHTSEHEQKQFSEDDSYASASGNSNCTASSEIETTLLPDVYKEDLEEFISCSFFGCTYADLKNWEEKEVEKMFDYLHSRHGIVYPRYTNNDTDENGDHKNSSNAWKQEVRLKPRLMPLECVNPLHRPLAVYTIIWALRKAGNFFLRLLGFGYFQVKVGTVIKGGDKDKKCKVFTYWYRPPPKVTESDVTDAKQTDDSNIDESKCPILFFHGIAPAGLSFYIPALQNTLFSMNGIREVITSTGAGIFDTVLSKVGRGKHPIFLFENEPVTCSMTMTALTENETVTGILEALSRHGWADENNDDNVNVEKKDNKKKLKKENNSSIIENANHNNCNHDLSNKIILCGHSLGSCQLTWLLRSPKISHRIHRAVFLDPVVILVSEPDLQLNFIYGGKVDNVINNKKDDNDRPLQSTLNYSKANESFVLQKVATMKKAVFNVIDKSNKLIIRLIASSELYIEYHIRRHFAWYNNELWLEDIPKDVDIHICIAGKDAIINAAKVRREVLRQIRDSKVCSPVGDSNIKLTYWHGMPHGAWVMNHHLWNDVVDALRGLEVLHKKVE